MKKENISVLLIMMVFISSIIQFGNVLSSKFFLFEFSILLAILWSFFVMKFSNKIYFILILFFPVLGISLISSFIENNIINFLSIFFYFLSFVSCIILGGGMSFLGMKKIIYNYMCVNIIIHFLGFFLPNVNNNILGYTGIFGNPNVYGMFSSFSILFIFLFLIVNKIKFNIYYYLFFLINLIFLLITVSRTALVSLFVVLIICFLYMNISNIGLKINNKKIISIIFSIVLLLLLYFIGAFDRFINKGESLEGDITNGRMELWMYAIDSLKFSGYGHSYYKEGQSATHNNYLNIGVVYGGGVMLGMIFIWLSIFIYLQRFFLMHKSYNALLTLSILFYGLIYWFFEVGSSFVFIWVMAVMMGYSCFNIRVINNKIY